MECKKDALWPFSPDAGRMVANLETAHHQWVDVPRAREELPVYMFWQTKNGRDYLAIKPGFEDSGTTVGYALRLEPSITNQPTHDGDILLLHPRLVVFFLGARTRLLRPLRLTVIQDALVREGAFIVRVHAHHCEG